MSEKITHDDLQSESYTLCSLLDIAYDHFLEMPYEYTDKEDRREWDRVAALIRSSWDLAKRIDKMIDDLHPCRQGK